MWAAIRGRAESDGAYENGDAGTEAADVNGASQADHRQHHRAQQARR